MRVRVRVRVVGKRLRNRVRKRLRNRVRKRVRKLKEKRSSRVRRETVEITEAE